MDEQTRSQRLDEDEAAKYRAVRDQIEADKTAITGNVRAQLAARRREAAAAKGVPTLGERLRAARRERGLTQVRLAADARVSQGYLSQLERDLREPTLSIAARLADALGISLDELASCAT